MSLRTQLREAVSPVRSAALVAAAVFLAGCSDTPLSVPDPEGLAAGNIPVRGTPQAQNGPLGLDRVFYDISGHIPGFAGFYFDADGTVNVLLVNLKQNGLARRTVSDLVERTRGRALGHMKVNQVKYDFRQLYRWQESIVSARDGGGLTRLGICVEQNRICMGVHRGGGLASARAVVARLGIPADAIILEEHDPIEPTKYLTERFSPVPGGVEITPGCTLGFNALFGLQRVFVTAAHCTPEFGDIDPPSVFGQPNNTRLIGVESWDPPTYPCMVDGVNYSCRKSDAAEFQYYDSVAVALGRIARPWLNTNIIDPNNPEFRIVGEQAMPFVGERVSFVGRVSGWREGRVSVACMKAVLGDKTVNGLPVLLECVAQASVAAQKGDSGAPVFYPTTNPLDVKLGGIVSGTSGTSFFYSPMETIEVGDNFGNYQTVP